MKIRKSLENGVIFAKFLDNFAKKEKTHSDTACVLLCSGACFVILKKHNIAFSENKKNIFVIMLEFSCN
jgi:hypothetical protein